MVSECLMRQSDTNTSFMNRVESSPGNDNNVTMLGRGYSDEDVIDEAIEDEVSVLHKSSLPEGEVRDDPTESGMMSLAC